jgi:SAM-dependent methyltransferase
MSIKPAKNHRQFLICPVCREALSEDETGARCLICDHQYPSREGQLDLRPPQAVPVFAALTVHPPGPTAPGPFTAILPTGDAARAQDAQTMLDRLPAGLRYGNRLTPALASHLPAMPGGLILDLGCGGREFAPILEAITGAAYVGIDYDGPDADILADAHVLPFADETFDAIVSLAVLEHIRVPDIAVAEAMRVLKPAGIFAGTVAFLEPFHMNSMFHMTHLGLTDLLERQGFTLKALAPTTGWTGVRAITEMTTLAGFPGFIQRLAALPADNAAEALRRLGVAVRRRRKASAFDAAAEAAGGFVFVAQRAERKSVAQPRTTATAATKLAS